MTADFFCNIDFLIGAAVLLMLTDHLNEIKLPSTDLLLHQS